MMKHSIALLLAAATTALAGCQLYFGEERNSDSWTYCGQDGYYECTNEDCYWQGPECPAGMQPGEQPGGFECQTSEDCAAGCYCGNGICEEAGFCTSDNDCGNGFICNEERSSCEPSNPVTTCSDDAGCPAGQVCDTATATCTETCACTTDAEATAGGFDYCDETRGTCAIGVDPNGDCGGELTCNLGKPSCPEGQVPLIANGCWTGTCSAISACSTAPTCDKFSHESDCRAGTSCAVSYTGLNCKKPDNSPCSAGDTNCTCSSYAFASCSDSGNPRTVIYNGYTFDISSFDLAPQ